MFKRVKSTKMSKQIILITNMLTSTERMTVTDGARGDDKRNSSALSTEIT